MTDNKRLAFSIIRFLHEQLQSGDLSSGAQESLEVAVQCLETAFEVSADDRSLAVPLTLPEIFASAALQTSPSQGNNNNNDGVEVDEERRAEAERLKTDGNDQMKVENYAAAVEFYSKAISLNTQNAVYYCNRLALASLNRHAEAVTFYKKALELDPDNDTYKSNMKIAEDKMDASSPMAATGGVDLAGLLSNPGFMNMASSLMTNPQVQQMMSGMMSGAYGAGGGAAGGGGAPGPAPAGDLSGLIQAGQQFAQQMQQQNPELIEQLRSQIRNRAPSAGNEEQP
ncbi:small glutamine-rich tetratricopeptide repeat-containing protein alpha isoform X2 [Hippocampus zosterae]|uniref:small glutamine-rich tetratricopeptide repeat-containing protein alpha isoform X2 n=1 Tax=Hippocampus zosterae TaxID=109293 RepID=UPI00223CF9F3|nr:small glutamine-rich tetratricopeptide repeat-containing protein alpha isoform X2 [Hippocampus zosterae]